MLIIEMKFLAAKFSSEAGFTSKSRINRYSLNLKCISDRPDPQKQEYNFKILNIMLSIKIVRTFINGSVCFRNKQISKTLVFGFQFPGRCHFE